MEGLSLCGTKPQICEFVGTQWVISIYEGDQYCGMPLERQLMRPLLEYFRLLHSTVKADGRVYDGVLRVAVLRPLDDRLLIEEGLYLLDVRFAKLSHRTPYATRAAVNPPERLERWAGALRPLAAARPSRALLARLRALLWQGSSRSGRR